MGLRWPWPVKLVERAGNLSVVELAPSVWLPLGEIGEVWVAGQNVEGPGGMCMENFGHLSIKLLDACQILKPLPVRRIGDHASEFAI